MVSAICRWIRGLRQRAIRCGRRYQECGCRALRALLSRLFPSPFFFMISTISLPLFWSREAVGSSARTMLGFLISARAIATLWRCPPDRCVGNLSACSAIPTVERVFKASSREDFAVAFGSKASGSWTLCITYSELSRWWL